MRVNEDPELERQRRRARIAEQKLAKALAALEKGPAITICEREELIAELKGKEPPPFTMPAGAYC